jgi:hypothetical protein
MTSVINVKASLVSKLSGYNRYVSQEEALEELLTGNQWLVERLGLDKQKHQKYATLTEKHLAGMTPEELAQIGGCLGLKDRINAKSVALALTGSLRGCVANRSNSVSKDELSQFLAKHSSIRDHLGECLERDIAIKRGCYNESQSLNRFEKTTAIPVVNRNNTLYQKELHVFPNGIKVVVVGKVDGISQDGSAIVETKQRRNCLFNCVPVYEKVQLETYLWLTDIGRGIHVQNYEDQQKAVVYEQDKEFWEEICSRLIGLLEREIIDKL